MVLNVSTGALVRDIIGDSQLGGSLYDVLISTTGPQGTPELYVCDYDNHRIAVLDPMTGANIRSIGTGLGAGMLYKHFCVQDNNRVEGTISVLGCMYCIVAIKCNVNKYHMVVVYMYRCRST